MVNNIFINQELLEIVDENNKSFGIFKPRKEIHTSNPIPWHRVTAIWVVNKKGQVLCQKQSPNKTESLNVLDKWFPYFGGHITKGADFAKSALKELEEEIGLKIGENDLNFIETRKSITTHRHFVYVYVLNWDGDIKDLSFNDGEISEVKWMDFCAVEDMVENDKTRSPLTQKLKNYFAQELYK